MTTFAKRFILPAVAFLLLGSAGSLLAQGMTVLKLGWTYQITFPEVTDPKMTGYNLPQGGTHIYRVLQYGGDQWYRLQRVYKKENGGWYSVPNTADMWVNIGYAFMIREVTH